MSVEFRLPAQVQPQLWINENATDIGLPIHFDAHDALLSLNAKDFSRAATEILKGRGHDYDDIALAAGVIDGWLAGHTDATFRVEIDEYDFRDWLESIDLSEVEATSMNDVTLEEIKTCLKAKSEKVLQNPAP
jgi:hypothetical protein